MSGTPTFGGKLPTRILLVEDNDANRRLLSDFLSFCGYRVHSVATGTDFFAALTEFHPSLILLDLKLPGVDGFTLLEQLKHSVEWQHIPVIVISAFAFKADQQRAISLGASQYLIKPVGLENLKQAVSQELQCLN